jgi:peptidyl-prolyl cis-trans isomerase C
MEIQSVIRAPIASINDVALNTENETLTADELRQRACAELLRQAAVTEDLLGADDTPAPDGILSEAASSAIELLLEQALSIPEPSEAACRRHHAAHLSSYSSGEKVRVRHILFAVTPGVDVAALRQRAEGCLLEVRCHDGSTADSGFTKAAGTLSNCPSGADGGHLGWLGASDCAPEFAKELFGQTDVGVLPRLVHSRFGFHVVEVLERQPGINQPFEAVHGAVTMALRQTSYVTALRQYLSLLAGQATVVGVELDVAETPLVQ